FKSARKAVIVTAVAGSAEIQVIAFFRVHNTEDRRQAGVGARSGRQAGAQIGVVISSRSRIVKLRNLRPPGSILEANPVLNGWISIEFHTDFQAIAIDPGNLRVFLRVY